MGMCRPCRVFPFLHLSDQSSKRALSTSCPLPSCREERWKGRWELSKIHYVQLVLSRGSGSLMKLSESLEAARRAMFYSNTRMVTLGEFSLYSLSHLCSVTTSTEVMRIWGKLQGCTLVTVNKS